MPRRPVSIRFIDDAIPVELEDQELAPPAHASGGPAPRAPPSSAVVPRMTSGWTTLGWTRRAVRRGLRGWHPRGCPGPAARASRPSYVVLAPRMACGRLRGHCPQEGRAARAPERRSLSSPPATRTTSRSRKPGRAARALSSPGREPHHPRRCNHLTEPQQGETATGPSDPTTDADATAPETLDVSSPSTAEALPVDDEVLTEPARCRRPRTTSRSRRPTRSSQSRPPSRRWPPSRRSRPRARSTPPSRRRSRSPSWSTRARGRRHRRRPIGLRPVCGGPCCRSRCRAGARARHRHPARADHDGGAAQRAGRRDPEPQAR